jgi:hypothetical protein
MSFFMWLLHSGTGSTGRGPYRRPVPLVNQAAEVERCLEGSGAGGTPCSNRSVGSEA